MSVEEQRNVLDYIKALPRVFLYILCSPYVFYLGWKIEDHFAESRWDMLIAKIRRLARLGRLTPRDYFLLGFAHMSLGKYTEALEYLEKINVPLENNDEEACRSCTHSWVLHKLGRNAEANTLLKHSMTQDWSPSRLDWAKQFSEAVSKSEVFQVAVVTPKISTH